MCVRVHVRACARTCAYVCTRVRVCVCSRLDYTRELQRVLRGGESRNDSTRIFGTCTIYAPHLRRCARLSRLQNGIPVGTKATIATRRAEPPRATVLIARQRDDRYVFDLPNGSTSSRRSFIFSIPRPPSARARRFRASKSPRLEIMDNYTRGFFHSIVTYSLDSKSLRAMINADVASEHMRESTAHDLKLSART